MNRASQDADRQLPPSDAQRPRPGPGMDPSRSGSPNIASQTTRAWSITTHLLVFALAITAPGIVFVAILLASFTESEREFNESRAVEVASTISSSVDRQIIDMLATLRVLSTSTALQNGDLASFHTRTRAALQGTDNHVLLLDENFQQLANTRVPYGTPLGKTANLAAARRARVQGTAVISDVFFGQVAQNYVFNVILPVPREGGDYLLILTRNADRLARVIADSGLPEGWAAQVIDSQGTVLVDLSDDEIKVGQPLPGAIAARLGDYQGSFVADDTSGQPHLFAFRRSAASDWTTVVWAPVAEIEHALRQTWLYFAIGGVLLLAVSLLLANFFGRRLRDPIIAIAAAARRLGNGEVVEPMTSPLQEANDVSRALSAASHERREASEQLHFVMRELSHRTKNMLTVVMGIARQTAANSDDIADFESRFSGRLSSLAHSQDMLVYQNWTGAALEDLVRAQLSVFVGDHDRLDLQGPPVRLTPEATQSIGLALHELATNAAKYGALSTEDGRIAVTWGFAGSDGSSHLRLTWEESGGPSVAEPDRKGFGQTVIEKMAAKSLDGTVELDYRPHGLRWSIEFPKSYLA